MDTPDVKILKQFKKSLIDFIDELISLLPEQSDLILARIFLNDQVPIKEVMDWFIEQLQDVRLKIKDRDEEYFISNQSIFNKISQNNVNNFKTLWRGYIDDETKETIWKWLDSFVFLSDKYIKTINI
jgi:hypothetical protein